MAAPPVLAESATPHSFNIRPMPLVAALREFSRRTGLEIIVDPRLLREKDAPRVTGRMSADAALDRLMDGSGLEARIEDGAIIVAARARDTASAQPDDGPPLVITVTGFGASIQAGSTVKRRADQIVDAITSEEFGRFPDQNVAEAVQRIAGISMTRTNGEGAQVTVRGLEPDLTRVEINGRTTHVIGNVEEPGMATWLGLFRSDQFSRIDVIKSPRASDDEGGAGGTVRLLTPKPLDLGGFAGRVDAVGRYAMDGEAIDPAISGMLTGVLDDGRLGLLVSASHDDRTRRVDQTRNQNGWMVAQSQQAGTGATSDLAGARFATHFDQQFRLGSMPRSNVDLTVQYRPADTFEFNANVNLAQEDRSETVGRIAINLARGRPFIAGEVNDLGSVDYLLVDEAQFTLQNRGFQRATRAYGLTLNPVWETDGWILSGRADYSLAEQITHDRRVRHRSLRDAGYDLREDSRAPAFLLPGLELSDLQTFAIDQNIMEYGKAHTSETAAQVDLSRSLQSPIETVSVGLKGRLNRLESAQAIALGPTDFTFADASSPFPVDDFFSGAGGAGLLRSWPYVDAMAFVGAFGPTEADSEAAFDPARTYTVRHDTLAGYVEAGFRFSAPLAAVRGNVGVRVVHDRFSGRGWRQDLTDIAQPWFPVETGNSRTTVLPSLNIALEPRAAGDLVIRASAARVLSRPSFTQTNPTYGVNTDTNERTLGNPDLRPFLADQYDLVVERRFGPSSEGLLTAALFYKDIQTFVEPYTVALPSLADDQLVTTYRNGGSGFVSGLEVGAQTPFDILPAPFDRLGMIVNYTYLDSGRMLSTGRKVAIPGNSRHTANATLYYESGGFSLRGSYAYREAYLEQQFGPRGNAILVDADGRLDISARLRMENGATLSLDAANILSRDRYVYADQEDRMMLYQLEGPILTFGLGYTF